MGLTKQYLRYVPGPILNVIGSSRSNIKFVKHGGQSDRYVAVGACDSVYIWDTRKGEKVFELAGSKHEVSVLETSKANVIAVGYTDGSVRLFDMRTCACLVTFSGHKREVTALAFDEDGLRLASGSKDTDICIWDVVAESGIVRLSGHKKKVTQLRWISSANILVSSSEDTLVKFFDLDTNHCFKTLTSHRQEVLDFVITNNNKYLISGTKSAELKVFKLEFANPEEYTEEQQSERKRRKLKRLEEEKKEDPEEEEEGEDEDEVLRCSVVGTILRQQSSPVQTLTLSSVGSVLVCQGKDATVEMFRLLDEEEAQKRFAKRQKKAAKRARETEDGLPEDVTPGINDEVIRLPSLTATGKKPKSVDVHVESSGEAKLVILQANNSIEVHGFNINQKENSGGLTTRLVNQGHRTEPRSLVFSSDNIAIASASGESLKIWGRGSLQCIRTMPCDHASCVMFVPGDRHVLVGCKSGKIQIFDIASGALIEEVEAHSDDVKSLHIAPDQRGFISGSLDKTVKFWNFELIKPKEDCGPAGKVLTISLARTMTCDDAVLCARYSPDHRLIAVATSDFTVKVFFVDTLKLFLSLYGHKLPVVSMDISADSRLIITGSEDRNVKIWGLDFGDCHKSLFAHDDGITSVQFIAKTHMFFSVGKDGKLKQWDADNFERIITLDGHFGAVFAVSVTPDGKFVATSGMDRSIRLWERTNEPLVLEDERETEREEEAEKALATEEGRVVPGDQSAEAKLPSRKTAEAEKAAERLMEALDIYDSSSKDLIEYKIQCKSAERKKREPPPPPQLHPLMMAYGAKEPNRFLLEALRRIKSSELEEALIVLPMDYVTQLLIALERLLQDGIEVELVSRILFFLLRLHHGPVLGSPQLLEVIEKLRVKAEEKINLLRDTVGFNMAALQYLQREIEEREATQLFLDATLKARDKRKKKNRKELAIRRAVLTL